MENHKKEALQDMDEKMIIREQERLAKEAKRKKVKKRRRIISVIILVLLAAGIWYLGWGRQLFAKETENTVKIEKTAEQTVVFAQIREINGNEIRYAVAEEVAVEETTEAEKEEQGQKPEDTKKPDSDNRSEFGGFGGGEMPQMPDMSEFGGFGGGEMPQMPDMSEFGGFGGEMPDMSGFGGGEMPEMPDMRGFGGGEMPQMPDMSGFGGFGGGRRGENAEKGQTDREASEVSMFIYDGTTYRVGNDQVTALIPVGTEVTTKLGTVTTFSRLAAEDCIALVMEKDGETDVIVAVYIVG